MIRARSGLPLLLQLYAAERFEEALAHADALIESGSRALEVYRVRAYVCSKLGRVRDAIAAYRAALAVSAAQASRDETLHLELEFELGLELMRDGRTAEAAALVERTTSELPRLGLHPVLKTEAWRGLLPPPRLSPAARQRLGLSERALSLVRQVLESDDLRAFRAGFTDDLAAQYAISSNEQRPLVHDVIEAGAVRILGFLIERGLELGDTWVIAGQTWSALALARQQGNPKLLALLEPKAMRRAPAARRRRAERTR